jgi:outer membrane protein assembly factor BamB
VWRTPLASPTWSATPTISGDSVFVTSGTDAGTTIYRIEARTGRVIWHHAQPMPTDRMLGSIAVSGAGAVVGGSDGFVYCFNPANGKLRWKSQALGAPDDPAIYGGVAIYDGVVYTATFDYTTAMRLRDGHVLWHTAGGGGVVPAVGLSEVYIGDYSGTAMLSFNARTGRLRWSSPMLGADTGAPALANGVVYIAAVSDLEAYSASSGRLLFSYPISISEGTTSAPTVVNGRVYVGSADGVVRAFGLR